jgi:prepilin-type processing-associated H-X9-DG protein
MYPEYLPDLSVIVCPSDPGWSSNDLRNPLTHEVDVFRHCDVIRGWSLLDESYLYFGHVMDKLDDAPEHIISHADFEVLTGFTCDAGGENAPVSGQFTGVIMRAFGTPLAAIPRVVDDDYDLGDYAGIMDAPVGTGAGTTLMRLREGIERFLITDINSPGASSEAQSGIAMMWDRVSLVAREMNHVPGGANILYLDGHVAFEKYPGKNGAARSFATGLTCLL